MPNVENAFFGILVYLLTIPCVVVDELSGLCMADMYHDRALRIRCDIDDPHTPYFLGTHETRPVPLLHIF